jgi:predicted GNAT family N-acyltransferase
MIYDKALLSDFDEIVLMKDLVKQRIINEDLPIWKNGYPLNEMIKDDIFKGYGRVIRIDNKVVAYATFMKSEVMYPNENIFKKDNLYSFGRVMVCNEYLSKGIGRYLVSSMILEAKNLNANGLGIAADECNIKATKLYKSLGFEKEGEKDFEYAYLSIYGLYF